MKSRKTSLGRPPRLCNREILKNSTDDYGQLAIARRGFACSKSGIVQHAPD